MSTEYVRHQREYTILGITSVIDAMVGSTLENTFGTTLAEMISVVKNGTYWHFGVPSDRERASRTWLKKVTAGKIDLQKEYLIFDKEVGEFENILYCKDNEFSLETFLKFFEYYQKLFPIAYAGMDSADFVDELPENERENYIAWATKVRIKGELIYKDGEMKFLPRYTKWLSENILKNYTATEIQYITGLELKDYINNQTPLPSPDSLQERINYLYIRQFPNSELTLLQGKEAENKIAELGLFNLPEDKLVTIKEIKGKSAYPGIVKGQVRIIRSRQDMANFQDNEIIVSGMTDPSYLPIMKRAAAFVTNEGGLLCHAAIVARELKKPCIIATKFATHAFKDGELVEVDAVSGVVRRT